MFASAASRCLIIAVLTCFAGLIGTVSRSFGQLSTDGPLTADKVAKAIDRGIEFLKSEQQANGQWRRRGQHPGGVTALCTLALLNAGVSPQDEVIQKAIRQLDRVVIQESSVYSVSLMTMVYCAAEPDNRQRIRSCVEYLETTQIASGNRRNYAPGGWSYALKSGRPDSSNSQFALLALHEASLVGIEVQQRVWQQAQWYWETMRHQKLGGYRYVGDKPTVTGSMTCAGISSVIIIDENLPKRVPYANGKIVCCGDGDRLEEVEAASQFVASRFSVSRNPASGFSQFSRSNFYFLYGLERAARLSGQRFFGQHDWYREGASYLIRAQRGGSWRGSTGHGEEKAEIATALALLFLAKGRRPIVIGKYRHSDDNDWDRHRKGIHYLTRALEADWEKKLNWQTIEGRYASVQDLLETPVLFISGRDGLKLNATQKENLRKYVQFGGFVFAEACQGDGCGNNVQFEKDFLNLMNELFPQNPMQRLDPSHPIFSAQYALQPNPDRPLFGMQSSCRTSVVYCPRNLSGIWRVNRPSFMDQLPEAAQKQVNYATQLGVNVISFATGREIKRKLDRPKIAEEVGDSDGQRVVLIPKLRHNGGADDAPNAWQNIMRRARIDLQQRFRIKRDIISPQLDQLARNPMVFMHGRSAFQWTEQERTDLQAWLSNGGFLFADSICAGDAFVKAFRKEMKILFPDNPLQVIPPSDPLWSARTGGYQLDKVTLNQPGGNGQPVRRIVTAPRMQGIRVNDRWVVVFSPHDLSCALENASANQCLGYDKDDASRMGVNIILYALKP